MAAAITKEILLERTGRENGPDFMLKVEVPAFLPNSVLNTNSNITEVLNVIAYLCNNANRTDVAGIEANQSVSTTAHGQHVPATGQYNTPNTGNGASNDTLWLDDTGAAATTQMINLDTLQSLAYTANHIPVGILARTPVPGGLGNTYPTAADLVIAAGIAGPIPADTLPHFSNAIKQMINILENTRTIFGPKGWTALFSKVKGGGGGAKRTHRQHRRKYSSKHY
jgi:hypothetical protein